MVIAKASISMNKAFVSFIYVRNRVVNLEVLLGVL